MSFWKKNLILELLGPLSPLFSVPNECDLSATSYSWLRGGPFYMTFIIAYRKGNYRGRLSA